MINALAQELEVQGFERGIDRDSPRTMIKAGGYEAAENVLLRSADSGRHIASMLEDAVLDPLVEWPAGTPTWFAPFTYPVYDSVNKVLSYVTQLVIFRDTGQMHTYVPPTEAGTAGTVTNVRRGFVGSGLQANHWVYDKWLCTCDGRNAPMKYGQHFLWNGQLEPTPFMYPLGSLPVTPFVPDLLGETWTFIGGGTFMPDGSLPGGGARIGSYAARITRKTEAAGEARVAFSPTKNFLAGPQPYGGDDFADTDSLVISVIAATDGTTIGRLRVRFMTSTTKYFEFTFTPMASNTAWKTLTALRSDATVVSTPTWDTITEVRFFNDDTSLDVCVDDCYFIYTNAPPAFAVATSHKTRIVGGGAPVGSTPGEPFLSTLLWSKAGLPDNYPSANTQAISGGFESLAKSNQITSVREFGDTVIIGAPNAIFSWTIGDSGNPVKSTVSTEHGIDSHRGLAETPQGSLIFQWQRGIYILRAIGRQYIGTKIAPLLANLHLNDPSWTVSVVDEATKTIRLCFREGDAPTQTTGGVVFDYVAAQELGEPVFPSSMTALFDFAVAAYVDGKRETLYCKAGSSQIYRLHVNRAGSTLPGSLTLPWMSEAKYKDKLTKWLGIAVPYVADVPLTAEVRYANVPGEFNSATYTQPQVLIANPTIANNGRVQFAGTTKWAQVRFRWNGYVEIYPPLSVFGLPTERPQ